MKHFFRTSITPLAAVEAADGFFAALDMAVVKTGPRTREYSGELGKAVITARPEGGHYTMVEGHTDQPGESRLDRNVKRFFVELHRQADPRHELEAAY
jgi:hypothetical protein